MLPEYQLKIADLYNAHIGNVKKLVPTFFNKECDSLWKLETFLTALIKN